MTAKHSKRKDRPGVGRAGRSPLHYAAADGKAGQVSDLLASGSEPGAGDDDGWTPLQFAAQASATSAAALLLDAGAPVDARDANGNTPLFRAVFNSQGRGDLIALLRERGADPRAENIHGVSPVSLVRTIASYNVRQFFEDLPQESTG